MSPSTARAAGALAASLLFGSGALAQEPPDTFRLNEIVVTATRIPLARLASPAAVTVLHGEDLRARGIHFVADALRTVPGGAVARNGSTGALTTFFLRGGESNYVQVLIDGVKANSPGGSFDFADLTTDDIDRIEIVRGPVSVLYGSDAVTGVIQIFTRRGEGAPRVTATVSGGRARHVGPNRAGAAAGGSFGLLSWDAGLAGGGPALDYSFGAAGYRSGGAYAFNNDYDNVSLAGRVSARAGDAGDVAFTGRYTSGEFHYPTDGAGALVDANQFNTSRSLALGLEATHSFSPTVDVHLLLATHRFDRTTRDTPDGPADTLGVYTSRNETDDRRTSAELRANVRITQATTLTIGAAAERESGTSAYTSESSFGPFESNTDDVRSNIAGYAQLLAQPFGRFTITAGGRAEHNEEFGGFLTYRAGASYRLASGTVLRGAIGTAFKEPTFFENFAEGFVKGNPDLEPERSLSREVGAEQLLFAGRASLGATWFDQRFTHLIQYTGTPPAEGAPNYFNVGRATARGLELTARVAPAARFDLSASYTFLETDVSDAGYGFDRAFLEGQPLLRRPKHAASVVASYLPANGARLDLTVNHVGARGDLDFTDPAEFAGVRVTLPAYTTVDAGGEYAPFGMTGGSDLSLTLRVENVFDAEYAEIFHFPARGRTVFIGAQAALAF